MPNCEIHGIPLVCFCPACRGSVRSKRKATSSRKNGLKGGRPRKKVMRNDRRSKRNSKKA